MRWNPCPLLDQTTLATTGSQVGTMGSSDTQGEVRGITRKPMGGTKPSLGAQRRAKAQRKELTHFEECTKGGLRPWH